MIEVINGDILDAKEKYIAHQTNCVSKTWSGVARVIFEKYTYANTYLDREIPNAPGTIDIWGDGEENRFVINMYGQMFPGRSNEENEDNANARQKWFYACLTKISKIKDLESIAMPYYIACGLAGGDWEYYYSVISNFEKHMNIKYGTKVIFYRLRR